MQNNNWIAAYLSFPVLVTLALISVFSGSAVADATCASTSNDTIRGMLLCDSPSPTVRIPSQTTDVMCRFGTRGTTLTTVRREAFVHQGDGNGLPRNSMEALMRTWDRGAIPETDVRFTKDGVLISFHDGAWKGRRIADCTWAELRDEPVAAARGEQFASVRIPTMDAVFSAMKGHPDRCIFLDDKDAGPMALALMARRYGVGAQVIYHTDRSTRAREWKWHCPEGKANVVIGSSLTTKINTLAVEDFTGVDRVLIIVRTDSGRADPFVNPSSDELKKAIAVAHRHGVLVNVFFFGDAGLDTNAYARAISLGADSIGTERTDAFFAWIGSM